jgi:hypothetical protein
MINKKKIFFLIVCLFISLGCTGILSYTVAGASGNEEKNITINGKIYYYIPNSGLKDAKYVYKILNNYPITLFYEDENGKKTSIDLYTDKDGKYSKVIKTSVKVKYAWIEIKSENKACLVHRDFGCKAYKFTSKKIAVSAKKNKVDLNVRINKKI